jgi:hypothetical protein
MGNYQTTGIYNPVHHVMLFGGGNNSSNTTDLYKLDVTSTITRLNDAPQGMGVMQSVLTVDPVSGDYLVFFSDGTFWSYDVMTQTWTKQPGSNFFDPVIAGCNSVCGVLAVSISTYGVNMFIVYAPGSSRVYLYKHSN